MLSSTESEIKVITSPLSIAGQKNNKLATCNTLWTPCESKVTHKATSQQFSKGLSQILKVFERILVFIPTHDFRVNTRVLCLEKTEFIISTDNIP